MQLPPSPAWSFCIKHYLFLKCRISKPLRLFSDGNTGMVFTLRGELKIYKNGGSETETLPGAFVYGQLDKYHDILCNADTEMLIIVFQPYGYFSLSGMPADELRAQIIDAYLIFGRQIYALTDALKSAYSFEKSISTIETYFAGLLNTPNAITEQLGSVVNTVIKTKGQLTVNGLVRLTGYTERQLERLFHRGIGTSPAKYLQIVKIHYFLSLIRSTNKPGTFTIAGLESGYYDQPHLVHNFRQITGLTPTQYLSSAGTLAVNLVIIN